LLLHPRSALADHVEPLTQAYRLNNRALQMNATGAVRIPQRKEPWCRSMDLWRAAAVLIRVWIEGSQPLAGTAAIEGGEPLRFDGWLELLRVVSELVAARTTDSRDSDRTERADGRSQAWIHADWRRKDERGELGNSHLC
jgi:hypothetical protein